MRIYKFFVIVVALMCGLQTVVASGEEVCQRGRYGTILNLVHHNPGEPRFVTEFNDPKFLKSLGYTGQIPKLEPQCGLTYDRFERGIVPLHSPEREWILRQAAEFRKYLAIAKKASCPVYPWIDVLVLPKSVMEKYEKEMSDAKGRLSILCSRTRELMTAQIEEFFWRYPTVDGLTIRFGETYLHDTPHHKGGSPADSIEEHIELINLLRREVCVKRGKALIYRTWGFSGFHSTSNFYLKVTDVVEPHSNLVFSIKHTQYDFARNVPFNPTVGIGRHQQIVEISMNQGGNYGKNAYPYYFARGIIDGFHDMKAGECRGLRSLNDNRLVRGFWLWTWGDGWNGPFFDNELWLRLNEAVVRGFALHPDKSEEEIFNGYARNALGLSDADVFRFRAFCLATEDAVYKGQHTDPGYNSNDMFWCRDNHFCPFNLDMAASAGILSRVLKEKRSNLDVWRRLEQEICAVKFRNAEDRHFAALSTTYGRIKYEVSEIVWRIAALLAEEKSGNGSLNRDDVSAILSELDEKYKEWDALAESDPACPTLYETDFGWPVLYGPVIKALRERIK